MKACLRALSALSCCLLLAWAWASSPVLLTRGPYLQSPSATGLTLVCRTDRVCAVTLRCGEQPGPPWELETTSAPGTTHVFELAELRPETRYDYQLDVRGVLLAGDAQGEFRTFPPAESRAPFRFLAWGDSGTGNGAQRDVAAVIQRTVPAPAMALLLGDLVYDVGAREDYDWKVFAPYASLFRKVPFLTALGNHDVDTEQGAPYFEAFHLPTTTGAPGHPSGTEHYYSFEHGMAHFACLDSESSSSEPGSPMYTWLQDDLDAAHARGQRWLVVYMHHPVYSRGTHDSTQEGELIRLHDDLVPLFEAEGVDLVVSGHSHVYERSYLLKDEAILQSDPSDYTKIDSPDGTLYLVTGCAGEHGTGPLDLPIMARAYGDVLGFSLFDVSWEELRGRFVERDGRTTDLFTLHKALDSAPPRVATAEVRAENEIALVFDEPVQPGTGPAGAENPANYLLAPSAAVLAATLDSDASTVVLTTSPLADNRAYSIDVRRVSDGAGHAAEQRVLVARALDPSRIPDVAVPRDSEWRYVVGFDAPPPSWNAPGFDDSRWSSGSTDMGYGYPDVATDVSEMRNATPTLYLRTRFSLDAPAELSGLALNLDYDDGFVAYLNGTEIARDNVQPRQTNTTLAQRNHRAGEHESFDVGALRALLVPGVNVLAVEGHNVVLDGEDFLLDPELVATTQLPHGAPPRAVLRAPVRTANVPARIHFSAAGSADVDGPLAALLWDFGDGTSASALSEVDHDYVRVGTYTATLVARDADGNETLAQETIRVHDQGLAPLARLSADATEVPARTPASFDAAQSLDPDGGELTFRWDFGDPLSGAANFSSAPAPTHTYARSGAYTAVLVATDDEGSSATAELGLTVGPPAGNGGGGGCSLQPVDGKPREADPVLAAILAVVLLALLERGTRARRTAALRA